MNYSTVLPLEFYSIFKLQPLLYKTMAIIKDTDTKTDSKILIVIQWIIKFGKTANAKLVLTLLFSLIKNISNKASNFEKCLYMIDTLHYKIQY